MRRVGREPSRVALPGTHRPRGGRGLHTRRLGAGATRSAWLLLRRGVDLAAIARTEKQSGFLAGYMRTAFPEGVGRAYSLGEASQLVGLDVELVRRFSEVTGLPEEGRPVGEADVEA